MKTPPKPHQKADFAKCRDRKVWSHWWDMGVGKSWMGIQQAEYLFRKGEIDALLIVAPPSVHEMWVTEQLPEHCDLPWTGHVYHASKAKTIRAQQEWRRMMTEEFPVFVITYPAFRTTRGKNDGPKIWVGKELVRKFLEKRKCLYILDESQRVKTPGAKVTKSVVASGAYAKHKRLLSGTSITNSPFDVYTQVKFLHKDFWPSHGYGSYQSFKTEFGVFEEMTVTRDGRSQAFKKLICYKNLDRLSKILKEISDRHLTSEVLALPERTFSKRYFDPSSEQKRMYKDLAEDFYTFIEESGDMISSQLAITRMVRFQQLLSGFVEKDREEGGGRILLKDNPRLGCLMDILENDVPGKKVIIWARFRQDIDFIMDKLGDQAIRYDGVTSLAARLFGRGRFKDDPKCLYFVANPAAAGTGLTLNSAQTVIYYTNSFNLEQRLQSQARNFRIGQEGTVNVIDILARGLPFDGNLLSRLRVKKKMLDVVMGDKIREWV